jgi:hypothetical protein
MKTKKKPTKELQPGDKVVWGDGDEVSVDLVTEVEHLGEPVLKINVTRPWGKAFFYAGHESVQNVVEE